MGTASLDDTREPADDFATELRRKIRGIRHATPEGSLQ
jgi:hypothetical protein